MQRVSALKKALAALLAAAMVFGVFISMRGVKPGAVTAESASYGDVHLDKTAWLEADGTYSIKLEAYATDQANVFGS